MRQLLRNIAEISAGQGAPQGDSNYCDYGIPFVKAGNLQELMAGGSISDIQKVSDEVAKKHKLKLYPKGTVLFAKSGMSCLKGYVYVLPQDAYVVSHLACITPNEDISEFLRFYFAYHKPNQLIKDTSYPSISLADIGAIEIDIKDALVRDLIITALKTVEEVIALRKTELQKMDELIKARFVEMFGNPVTDSMNWGQRSLKDMLVSIRYGTSTPPQFTDEGYAFIRATNIKNGHIVHEDMKYIPQSEADRLEKCKLSGREIIIVRSGVNAGDTCVVTNEYIGQYAGYDMILVLNELLNPVFFNTLVNTEYMDRVVKPMTRRAAQPHLNSEQTQSFPIICVPRELQDQFEMFVEQIDKSKVIEINRAA